ncbi:glycosyltransferase [Gordonia sp. NPDC003376]
MSSNASVIVHEWIEETGGSETVVQAFRELLPRADIVCLWNDAPNRFPGARIRQSPLSRTPLRRTKALSIPFQPLLWQWVPGSYDFALISSHLFAHHARFFRAQPELRSFIYVHTPARYIWEPQLDPRGAQQLGGLGLPVLRAVDRWGARGPRTVAANSAYVAERIRRSWDDDPVVIHPPVDVRRITTTDWTAELDATEAATVHALPGEYLFCVGRMIGYKRFDLAIRLAHRVGMPLVLAGSGPLQPELEALAAELDADVTFLGRVSDPLMYTLHARATAFVFLGTEDFGISTVEAMALGTPVIAADVGGSTEIVTLGLTGALIDPDAATTGAAVAALEIARRCDRDVVRADATRFSKERFLTEISDWTGLPAVADAPSALPDPDHRG